jgi:hypothetical protein
LTLLAVKRTLFPLYTTRRWFSLLFPAARAPTKYAPTQMTAASRQTLEKHRLGTQYATLGKPMKLDGKLGIGIYTAVSYSRPVHEGGASSDYSATMRLRKADWQAFTTSSSLLAVQVNIPSATGWQTLRIMAVEDAASGSEWRLTLAALA